MPTLIPEPTDPAEYLRWVEDVVAQRVSPVYPDAAAVRHHHQVVFYAGMSEVGSWFGVSGSTVSKWRARYAEDHPCPEPDAWTGQTPGWLPARRTEWEAWHAARPGQGAAGRPKPRRALDLVRKIEAVMAEAESEQRREQREWRERQTE